MWAQNIGPSFGLIVKLKRSYVQNTRVGRAFTHGSTFFTVGEAVRSTCGNSHDDDVHLFQIFSLYLL